MANYVGNKGGQTILPVLANLIPKSKRYFSFFIGAGGLEFSEHFIDCNWIVSEKDLDLQLKATASAIAVYKSYQELVEDFIFTSEDFIFCDPPYLLKTRTSGRKYYRHEFSVQNHVKFLDYIGPTKAKVLITHPFCDLYDTKLLGWNKINFSYQTRVGWFNDGIYTNYLHSSVELVTYNFLGNNRTQRQAIKRKRANIIKKINNLSFHERCAIFRELKEM